MKISYKTAKVTGFGGTLDNIINDEEQESSCRLKEAFMKVVLYRI